MKERITNWFRNNNGNPLDDNVFFNIVIDSIDEKIEQETFIDALSDVNEEISEDEIGDVYKQYELLRNFILYYRCNH